jgi:membrane protease YdiL (CAAX protease family)
VSGFRTPFVAAGLALILAVVLAAMSVRLYDHFAAAGFGAATGYLWAQAAAAIAAAAFLALFWRRLAPGPRRTAYGLVAGFLFAAAAVMSAFALAAPGGGVAIAPAVGPVPAGTLAVWLAGWVIHAFVEEALFRGVAQPALAARYGPLVGVIGAALLWTWLQAAQGYAQPLQLAISFLVGFGFGALALRYGLGAAVGAHAGWGFIELVLLRGQTGLVDLRFTAAGDTADAPTFLFVMVVLTIASLTPFLLQRWTIPPRGGCSPSGTVADPTRLRAASAAAD